MSNEDKSHDKNDEVKSLSRRELITKYGAYTAPTVISMLIPSESYGHNTSAVYSTSAACAADTAGTGSMHQPPPVGLMGHCMLNGSGGMNAHTVINPNVP